MTAENKKSMDVFWMLIGSVSPGKRPKIAISKTISIKTNTSTSVTTQSLDRNGQAPRGSTFRHQLSGLPMRVAFEQVHGQRIVFRGQGVPDGLARHICPGVPVAGAPV